MGFLKPNTPDPGPAAAPLISPAPLEPEKAEAVTPVKFDPKALSQARQRAEDAKNRKGRRTLRIPLASSVSAASGSGLQLPA